MPLVLSDVMSNFFLGLGRATFFLARVGFGLAFFGPGWARAGLFWPARAGKFALAYF